MNTLMFERVMFVLLPVTTGLASVLWSMLAQSGPMLQRLCSVAVGAITIVILYGVGFRLPEAPSLREWTVIGAYIAVDVVVVFSWIIAFRSHGIVAVGLVEIGYPIFVILFAWLLLGKTTLNLFQLIGGVAIFCGSALIIWSR